MNFESVGKFLLSDTATLAGMVVSFACLLVHLSPTLAIVGHPSAAPSWAFVPMYIGGLPITHALAATKIILFYIGVLFAKLLTAPIAIDNFTSPTTLRDLLPPRAYVELKVAQWKRQAATHDIALPELRGANLVAFNSTEREVILSGPAGTGKSLSWLTKAHYVASKYPGARVLLLRKTRESMTDSVLVTFERDVLGDGHPLTFGPSRETRHSYKYDNGSEIVVAGMKQSGKVLEK